MIAIIDYGMGNLHSVANALKKINIEYCISSDSNVLKQADGLILPGVGAFYDCMETLKKNNLDSGTMDMIGSFTVLRFTSLLAMRNVFFTKEELLKMNRKLNRIKKPKV